MELQTLNAFHKIQLLTQLPTRSTVKLIDTKVVIQRSRLTLNQVHLLGVCTYYILVILKYTYNTSVDMVTPRITIFNIFFNAC